MNGGTKIALGLVLFAAGCAGPGISGPEEVRYLRLTPRGAGLECTFSLAPADGGGSITSVTGSLTVAARYGPGDALLDARAALRSGETAQVEVAGGIAKVVRPGHEPQEFDAPAGVIVTSAPDWTDTFRICRRWNRAGPDRQEFPGLWIHPLQPAQRLTFTAERQGSDVLESGLRLERLSIRLRGNSAYVAWVDSSGRMIKLAALPSKPGSAVLVLEGFEGAAAGLQPK